MQNAAIQERVIDAEYHPIRITAGQLRPLKSARASSWLGGFNVTAPLKEAVAELCDGRTDQAREIGAVNTVRIDEEGRWLGHNTDGGAILTVLSQAWGDTEPARRAVVLGTGGSARATVSALLRWGVPRIEVCHHSNTGGRKFGSWLERRDQGDRVSQRPLAEDQEEPGSQPTVWICCLAGGVSIRSFLPVAAGTGQELLLDLRYADQRPLEEPPLGCRFVDGLPVLLMQGGLSFAWWFGPPVPWTVMRQALGS
jgi:shikimate dehydrogenase